jgi:conserved oligomeric Golgi complex subunit 4
MPKFITTAALSDKIIKIKSSFESLETFFFRRSLEKAFQLDEPSSQTVPTTSVVDDVMFVLRKVLDRAMGTGDAELLKTICANTRRILDLDFAGAIKRRVTMDSQRNLQLGKDDGARMERIRPFLAELNNLAISSEHVTALTEGYLSANLDSLFPFEDQLQIAKTALMNIGNLKERFNGYLHVLHSLMGLMNRKVLQLCLRRCLSLLSRNWSMILSRACIIS